MPTVKVTNICQGQRGIFRQGDFSTTMIEPGASEIMELNESDFVDAEATGWFSFSEPDESGEDGEAVDAEASPSKSLDQMTKAELLAVADAENILVIETAAKREIVAAIEAHRLANG